MKCSCGGKTHVVNRRDNYRRRECLVCGMRFSTKEELVVLHRGGRKTRSVEEKKQPRRKTVDNPMPVNNREQVTKSASARRRLEEMRDNIEDGYEYEY